MYMKYVALLRGINVGGKNSIKMSALISVFEKCGFSNVSTYINSGNVLFEIGNEKMDEMMDNLRKHLSTAFHFDVQFVLRSHPQLSEIVHDIPKTWSQNDVRKYIAFITPQITMNDVIKSIHIKEGIDEMKAGKNVVYMSTKLSGLTKSGFTKLIGTKIYKDITIRNYNTVQKLLTLMEK
jgi:uncharacterized protein (DUF1697 family)